MEKKRATDRAYRTGKRIEARIFIWDFKFYAVCENCGSTLDLEFHHRDPTLKRYKVSRLVQQGRSLKTIWKEMEKCAILCHHCHRVHHDGDVGYYGSPAPTSEVAGHCDPFIKSLSCEADSTTKEGVLA